MNVIDRRFGLAEGLAMKAPCRVATTAAITLAGLQTIDSVTAVEGDRVLVKNQADLTQNGVYIASSGDWQRDADFDGANDIVDGTQIFVRSGTQKGVFRASGTNPIILGSSAITFAAALDMNVPASIENVDALVGLGPFPQPIVYASGYYTAGDGGGGPFRYDADSSATVDGGMVFNGPGGVGRYLRLAPNTLISAKLFGADPSQTDNATALATWLKYLGDNSGFGYVPAGTYNFLSQVVASIANPIRVLLAPQARLLWKSAATTTGIRLVAGDQCYPINWDGGQILTEQVVQGCALEIDFAAQIDPTNVDTATYGVGPAHEFRAVISNLRGAGTTAISTNAWKDGVRINCGKRVFVRDSLFLGMKGTGSAPAAGIGRAIAFVNHDGISRAITAITNASPAVVTYDKGSNPDPANGASYYIDGTGLASLDRYIFVCANVNTTAGTFDLANSDTTADATYSGTGGTFEGAPQVNTHLVSNCKGASWRESVYDGGSEGLRVNDLNFENVARGIYKQQQLDLTISDCFFKCSEFAVKGEDLSNVHIASLEVNGDSATAGTAINGIVLQRCTDNYIGGWSGNDIGTHGLNPITLQDCNRGVIAPCQFGSDYASGMGPINFTGSTTAIIVDGNQQLASDAILLVNDTSTGTNRVSTRSAIITTAPTADVGNLNPSNYTISQGGDTPTISVQPTISLKIGAIANGYSGRRLHLRNDTDPARATGKLLVLLHEDAALTSTNRMFFGDRMPRFLLPGMATEFEFIIAQVPGATAVGRWRPKTGDRWRAAFDRCYDFHNLDLPTSASGTAATVTLGSYLASTAAQSPLGIASLATGTTTTGGCSIGEFTSQFRAGRGAALLLARVAIETAVDGTDTYAARVGFHDAAGNTADVTDGIYWEYNWSGTAAQWQFCSAAGGTRTKNVEAGFAPGTNYGWLGVYLNGDWTTAEPLYSTDGAIWNFGTPITTNLPSGAGVFGFGAQAVKSAGTTSRNLHVDLLGIVQQITRGS